MEIRGRWKGGCNGRVVNLYINVKQLPTDGKVAAILCVGQPVKYKLKEGTALTRDWLFVNVVPGIREHFADDAANKIADVLALPCCGHAWIPKPNTLFHLQWLVGFKQDGLYIV